MIGYFPDSPEYMAYEDIEANYYSDRISGSLKVITIDPSTGDYISDTVKNLIIRKNEAF